MIAGWFCSLSHTGKFLLAMLFASIWNSFTTQDKHCREAILGSQKKKLAFKLEIVTVKRIRGRRTSGCI